MTNFDIQRFIGPDTLSLSEAMQRIDQNGHRILFLTNCEGVLKGSITDGDIRRYLLTGGELTGMAIDAANKTPRVATSEYDAKHLYHSRNFTVIPIVDKRECIIDLYCGEDGGVNAKLHKALNVPVVINAGGRGTRLDPFTRVLPKPLIPVGDLPIIEHIMKEYQTYNCNEFHIIVNYKRDLMKAYFADNDNCYNLKWYDEEKPLGTGGGLSLLRGELNSTFFFANCDVLLTADYADILKFHKDNENTITMICAYKNFHIPYGIVEMGINGAIEDMKEKPTVSFLTNTGVYIVEPKVMNYVNNNEFIGFPDIVKRVKDKGEKVAVFPIGENEWMDMGQITELEKMRIKLYGE